MMDYASFSDESRHSQGRYRSIAAVSLPAELVVGMSKQLAAILDCANCKELKWGSVGYRGTRDVDRAIVAVDFLLEHITQGVRADVLTWDTSDDRHDVPNRDDIANYERMFYHLHRVLMNRRGSGSLWHIRPDEQLAIDWSTIQECLGSSGTWRYVLDVSRLSDDFRLVVPEVRTFRTVDSAETPLCQLADLLAGMAAYTRTKSKVMQNLIHAIPGQADLFQAPALTEPKLRDRRRFQVIDHFYRRCESRKLGVSLRKYGYLRTYDPKNPINFWHYVPQHIQDKAPARKPTVDRPWELSRDNGSAYGEYGRSGTTPLD